VSETAAIEVTSLTRRFGGRTAVDEVTFTVSAGEVFGFLGPNGAGKTTTVRMLGGLLAPTSGSAAVAGIPVTADGGEQVRQRISVMPEAPGLYLKLSVAENLDYFARLYGIGDRAARIARSLDAVGLSARAGDLCGSLSKGLRQRAALARTLLNDPDAVFRGLPAVQSWRQEPPGRDQPGHWYTLTVTDPAQAAPAVTRALVGADADVLRVAEERASLEDVYLQLVSDEKNGKAAG
jgi:ABC-type transporter Mla maintaining outer membrane lipid asymmetry ATPase subunit MlaF